MDGQVNIIAAMGRNRELGKGNDLLWRIPDDLKRFKALTNGHPIVMGRKTFESIGQPLPGRTNIVVTRNSDWQHEGVLAFHSLDEALGAARTSPGGDEIFVIGGADIYAQSLPLASKLYLTLIEDTKDADAFFPEHKGQFPNVTFEEIRSYDGLAYRWADFNRSSS